MLARGGVGGAAGPRHASDPLAPAPGLLWQCASAHLDLWLLRRQLQLFSTTSTTRTMLTVAMQMLASAACKAAALSDDGYSVVELEAGCREAEQYLRQAAGRRQEQTAAQLELPPPGSCQTPPVQAPSGIVPAAVTACGADASLDAAQQRATHNLGSLPLLLADAPFERALELLKLPQWSQEGSSASQDTALQYRLAGVEAMLFGRARAGFSAPSAQLPSLVEVQALEVSSSRRHILLIWLRGKRRSWRHATCDKPCTCVQLSLRGRC